MYRLLIFDLDGTAIPNKSDGSPSANLVRIVGQLQERGIKVCAATGRPLFNSKRILHELGLKDPCIISGGTQIIDPLTEEIMWEKDMSEEQVREIMKIAYDYPYSVFFSDDESSTPAKNREINGPERAIYISNVNEEDARSITEKLKNVRDITAHILISWKEGCFEIHVTHIEATKKHALQILIDRLDIKKEEIVAAGDGSNDLPLFEESGYKIAMGNASDTLKEKADVITQSVDEDGLAKELTNVFASILS